jgi:hypothetical protein
MNEINLNYGHNYIKKLAIDFVFKT